MFLKKMQQLPQDSAAAVFLQHQRRKYFFDFEEQQGDAVGDKQDV